MQKVLEKCNLKNCKKGTLETKNVKVTKKVFVKMCVESLLPAIEELWPAWCDKNVEIQQDNATPHPKPGSDAILEAALEAMRQRGWVVRFV